MESNIRRYASTNRLDDNFINQDFSIHSFTDAQAHALYHRAREIVRQANRRGAALIIPQDFQEEFFRLVDRINLILMEDKDDFYSYFLFQMDREIRFDITSPTGLRFRGTKYVICFNPLIFLPLNRRQMASAIKHEILHIVSLHLIRAKELQKDFSALAINMAMDLVVNRYLNSLPPQAVTLEWVNTTFSLELEPFQPFEYYVEKIQTALDLREEDETSAQEDESPDDADPETAGDADLQTQGIATRFDPEKTHDLWQESEEIDAQTLTEFTKEFIDRATKGSLPHYLESLVNTVKNSKGELPWNLYLKRLMGRVSSDRKKTVTRRNRRQPERLDLRGELRSHKPQIIIALDISGSISDEEFNQAVKEVLSIVKNYNRQITIVECDSEIRRVYQVKSPRDVQERVNTRGGTKFSPVFEYANKHKADLLIYFTDGQGEDRLQSIPRGYQILWVLSGNSDGLSLKEPYGAVKKLKPVNEVQKEVLTLSDIKHDGYSMNDQEKMLL